MRPPSLPLHRARRVVPQATGVNHDQVAETIAVEIAGHDSRSLAGRQLNRRGQRRPNCLLQGEAQLGHRHAARIGPDTEEVQWGAVLPVLPEHEPAGVACSTVLALVFPLAASSLDPAANKVRQLIQRVEPSRIAGSNVDLYLLARPDGQPELEVTG